MEDNVDFTQDELVQLSTIFKALRVKPKMDTPDELLKWMTEYVSSVTEAGHGMYGYVPRLPYFGDKKGDTIYDVWRYQVQCLVKESIPHSIIAQSIRMSLRGEASRVVMRLGTEASIDQIINKMDTIYDDVNPTTDILSEFYSSKQQPNEDVTCWGLRLEALQNKAKMKGAPHFADSDETLRAVFYHGLSSTQMKTIARYKYDTCQTFDELRVAIRQIELDLSQRESPTQQKLDDSIRKKKEAKQIKQKVTSIVREQPNIQFQPQEHSTRYDDHQVHYSQHSYQQRYPDFSHTRCWRCQQFGHIAVHCTVRLDHLRRGQIKQQVVTTKDALGFSRKQLNNMITSKKDPQLIGDATESLVRVNGVQTKALLDTGATVSTVSEDFCQKYLSNTEIKPLTQFIDIECADGKQLPYLGYICASLEIDGVPTGSAEVFLLVVPTTRYHSFVPLLLGTNILSELMKTTKNRYGPRFLQTAELHTPWYLAFRCMTIREKNLSRNNNRVALVRCAEIRSIVVKPNSTVTIQGTCHHELPIQPTCAILQSAESSTLSDDLDITPTVVSYEYRKTGMIPVQISNITTNTVVIEPKSILCELQPVNVMDMPQETNNKQKNNFIDDIKISTKLLSEEQQKDVRTFLHQFADIFSTSDTDIGLITTVKHRIPLLDEMPFKQHHRRIPPSMIQEVRDHLHQLLEAGVIRKSHSPWSSNVVLCRKKDGKLRMCIDYRQLNQRTKNDSYALPRIDELLDSLGGNRFFSVIDMKSGYHQIEIEESHKERTAFTVGPLGFYEFNRMPFGLCNSPATYQRMMEDILGDYNMDICLIYLDDVIIFANTYEEHMDRLQQVFQRLREAGFKLSPNKCSLFMERVKYVGHIVSASGIEPDPAKIEKVVTWPVPTTPEAVRQFLGFVGYYRKFIKDFSKIAKPLNDLMPAPTKKRKGKKKSTTQTTKEWKWGEQEQKAFDTLKEKLASPPILGYPDQSQPYELHTDASGYGLGAVLYQQQDGVKKVIAYASRGLSKSEKNYPVHKLEFLALKWSVTEKFRDYLEGTTFTVMTDNNPLTYVNTTAKLDATGHRWMAALAGYNFNIKYRPGSSNADADGLSRLPDAAGNSMLEAEIPTEAVKANCQMMNTSPFIESLCMTSEVVDEQLDITDIEGDIDIQKAQEEDQLLNTWTNHVRSGVKPSKKEILSTPDHLAMLRNFERLQIIDNTLYSSSAPANYS